MIYRPRHSPRSFDKNSFEFLAESRGRLGGEDKRERERGREGSPGASSSPLLAISALARSRMQLQSSAHGRRIIETGKRENIVAELVAFMPWL